MQSQPMLLQTGDEMRQHKYVCPFMFLKMSGSNIDARSAPLPVTHLDASHASVNHKSARVASTVTATAYCRPRGLVATRNISGLWADEGWRDRSVDPTCSSAFLSVPQNTSPLSLPCPTALLASRMVTSPRAVFCGHIRAPHCATEVAIMRKINCREWILEAEYPGRRRNASQR